ncbi:hypothetical protein IM876_09225 [Serratia plymuthica]|uniref:hypothetical protein n=1 Tax=Serratia plymuthica TaxID=82996 RepID=UPI0019290221|nr:hypothetical protein [Serratia plymuthica]MBL3522844.1 hypothetical protein [Serratia plymuthica]
MTEKTTVYITKYALTKGIIKVEGEIAKSGNIFYGKGGYQHSSDFRMTLEEAIEKAEDMRRRKLESMKKKIALLESIDFKKSDPFSK